MLSLSKMMELCNGELRFRDSLFAYLPTVLEQHYRKLVNTSRIKRKGGESDYECHSTDCVSLYHLKVLPVPHTDLLAMVYSLRVERSMTFEPLEASCIPPRRWQCK
jgi:hypothetical protein